MQVLEYQTNPLSSQQSSLLNQAVNLNQNTQSTTVNQVINQTVGALNQTFQQIVDNVQSIESPGQNADHHSFEDDWNILYFVRLLFYVVVVLKLLEILFVKTPKLDIKQRVYRKYLISHSEMIKQFTEEDRKIMNTTLQNTIKNASIDKNLPKLAKKPSTKKVIFHETKNEYFQPKRVQQQQMTGIQALQMFLFQQQNVQQMQRQLQENQIEEQEFEITETIEQGVESLKQGEQWGKNSTITRTTGTQSEIVQKDSQVELENNENKFKSF